MQPAVIDRKDADDFNPETNIFENGNTLIELLGKNQVEQMKIQ